MVEGSDGNSMADILQQLRDAVSGLSYPSESDEPFEMLEFGPSFASARAAVKSVAPANAIVEVPMGKFFDDLVDDPQIGRLRLLQNLITENLADAEAFRVDRGSEVDIYLLGRAAAGNWVGVKTMSVET
jgi:hypothetical protein